MQISARKGVKFYQKEAISLEVEPARPQEELVVPLSVVKGEALMLAVQPGSRVEKYQVLARPEGEGCPVYAPVSGRFAEVVERRVPGLGKTPCARIEPEPEREDKSRLKRRTGRYTAAGGLQVSEERGQRKDLTLRRLVGIAKRAAIVDEKDGRRLWEKLEALEERDKPAWVYADGIDDQPFMAAGLAVLSSFGAQVTAGLRMLCEALSAGGGILARAGEEADALLAEEYFGFPVQYIKGKYPSAPAVDAFLESVYGIRFGVGALLALCRAVEEGTPQTTAVVTVAGDGVQAPLHIEAPLGVTVGGLLEQCGAFGVIQRVVAGGVMTGRIAGPQSPLHPGITALTAQAVVTEPSHTTCTGCGRCAQVCPAGLAPFYLYRVAKRSTLPQLEELGGWQCMECGCCSYVCPSGLPLAACTRWIRRTLEAAEKKGARRHIPQERAPESERTEGAVPAEPSAERPASKAPAQNRPEILDKKGNAAYPTGRSIEKAPAAGEGESGPASVTDDAGTPGRKWWKGFGRKVPETVEPLAADTGRLPSASENTEAADSVPPAKKRKSRKSAAASGEGSIEGMPPEGTLEKGPDGSLMESMLPAASGDTVPEKGKKRKKRNRVDFSPEDTAEGTVPEESRRRLEIPAEEGMETFETKKRKKHSRTSWPGEDSVDRMASEEGRWKIDMPASPEDAAEAETSPAKKRRGWGRASGTAEEQATVYLTADLEFVEGPAPASGKKRRGRRPADEPRPEESSLDVDTAGQGRTATDSSAATAEKKIPAAAGRKEGTRRGKNQ